MARQQTPFMQFPQVHGHSKAYGWAHSIVYFGSVMLRGRNDRQRYVACRNNSGIYWCQSAERKDESYRADCRIDGQLDRDRCIVLQSNNLAADISSPTTEMSTLI